MKTIRKTYKMRIYANKVGMVLAGGLNPVALAQEEGVDADNLAMSTMVEYSSLESFDRICQKVGIK